MSAINLTRNIFLEKEELVRLQQFLADDVSQKLFVKNTISFGLVLSDFVNPDPDDFKIQVGTNSGTIKLTTASFALDSDGLLISQAAFDNLAVPEDGNYYWVKVKHKYDPTEVGVCSITDVDGTLEGSNTLFQDVLRGQATEVPVKVRFVHDDVNQSTPTNDQVYEIVSVTSDTVALLTGGSFTVESGLKMIVIGSTPISETISATQLEGLYKYDSCTLELIAEEVENTIPVVNYIEGKEFYLARVLNTAGTITFTDKRVDWWTFNIPGIGGKLTSSNNLSDLTNLVLARLNLDVFSKAETLAAIGSTANRSLGAGSYIIGDIDVLVNTTGMYTITFPSVGTINYYVFGTWVGRSNNQAYMDATCIWTLVNRTQTSFTIQIKETGPWTQYLVFEYMIFAK